MSDALEAEAVFFGVDTFLLCDASTPFPPFGKDYLSDTLEAEAVSLVLTFSYFVMHQLPSLPLARIICWMLWKLKLFSLALALCFL